MLIAFPQIGPDSDPRDSGASEAAEPPPLPPHPLRRHNPWGEEAPDPDEGDIEHVEWNGPGGIHFSRTSYRSTLPPTGRTTLNRASEGMPLQTEPFGMFLQSMTQMMAAPTMPRSPMDPRGGVGGRMRGTTPERDLGRDRNGFPRSPLMEASYTRHHDGSGTYNPMRDDSESRTQQIPYNDFQG